MVMKRWLVPISLTLALVAATAQGPALAQLAPGGVPLTPSPGILGAPGAIQQQQVQQQTPGSGRNTESEIQRKRPQANVEEGPDQQTAPTGDQGAVQKVHINEIVLEGITVLDPDKVQAVVAPYENTDDSFGDLQALTDKLTNMYRDEGYVTSRVYIPPQKLANGVLVLRASEGIMGQLNVDEGRWFKERAVRRRFPMETGDNFDVDVLKRGLRRMNENPDMNVRAILKAGEQPRETDVTLKVTDRFPIHLEPSFDNMGRHLIGDNRLSLRAQDNNLLGFGDIYSGSVSFTRRTFGLINHYEAPINRFGTKLGFDHAYSTLQLGEQFAPLNIQGSASSYSPYISQDLFNRDTWHMYGDFAFDFKELDTNIAGQDFSHDALRVARFGLNLEEFDKWGRWFLRNEVGWGLPIFGGTSGFSGSPSRFGAGTKFVRDTATLIRTQKMPWNTFGILRAIGQYTPDRLVSAEQFQVGGAFTVRGYREGAYIGDSGFFVSGEWRFPFFLAPKSWCVPFTQENLRQNVQLVAFSDFGSVFTNTAAAGVDANDYAWGVGGGLRVRLSRFIVGRVDLGIPLLRNPPFSQNPRLHVGIQSELF